MIKPILSHRISIKYASIHPVAIIERLEKPLTEIKKVVSDGEFC